MRADMPGQVTAACCAQRRGLSLNPITTMYYIAPASFAFLSIPWFFIEARPMLADDKARSPFAVLIWTPLQTGQYAE
jgi:hypothetical protein